MAEQIASVIYHPKSMIRIDEAITPTLPNKSAKI